MKIRNKFNYGFEFCVLNIKEEISYTKIPLINTDFDDCLIISNIYFMEKIVNKGLKSFTARLWLP